MLQCDLILTHHILRSLSSCLFQLRPSMTARPNDGETTCRVRFCLDFGAAKQEVFVFLRDYPKFVNHTHYTTAS